MAGTSSSLAEMRARAFSGMCEAGALLGLNMAVDWERLDRVLNPPPPLWRRLLNWGK